MKTKLVSFFKNKLAVGLTTGALISCCIIAMIQYKALPISLLLQYCVGLCFMVGASYTDLKQNIIKNKLVLLMLTVYLLFAFWGFLSFSMQTLTSLINALLGSLFTFIVFGSVYLLTKRQLGGGDVKLAIVMGLYATSDRIIGALVYGLLLCALYSGVLLLAKKIGRKDTVPLAPFLTIGYFISMLFVL